MKRVLSLIIVLSLGTQMHGAAAANKEYPGDVFYSWVASFLFTHNDTSDATMFEDVIKAIENHAHNYMEDRYGRCYDFKTADAIDEYNFKVWTLLRPTLAAAEEFALADRAREMSRAVEAEKGCAPGGGACCVGTKEAEPAREAGADESLKRAKRAILLAFWEPIRAALDKYAMLL